MFTYKTFKIDTKDEECATLYEVQNKEIHTGGKGTGTGEFADKDVWIGFYPSFKMALEKMCDILLGRGENIDEVKAVLEDIKTVLNPIAGTYLTNIYKDARKGYVLDPDRIKKEYTGKPRGKKPKVKPDDHRFSFAGE